MLRKHTGRSWKVAAAFVAATAFMAPVGQAVAQTGNVGTDVHDIRQAGLEWIKVRNVRSGLMAWALDPVHNPEPLEVRMAREAEGVDVLQPSDLFDLPPGFQLPAGIVSVTAVAAQNTLAVIGTPQSIAELKPIAQGLDRRLQHIDVEVQFIALNEAGLAQFGVDVTDIQDTPRILAKAPPADFQQRLNSLVEQNKAKIVNAPRVTLVNRFSGRLGGRVRVPAQLTVGDNKELQQQIDALPKLHAWSKLAVGQDYFLRMKPTAVEGNTVSLTMAAVGNLQASEFNIDARSQLKDSTSVTLKTSEHSQDMTFEDGQTVMVSGLFPKWAQGNADFTNSLVFVTVKLVNRNQ